MKVKKSPYNVNTGAIPDKFINNPQIEQIYEKLSSDITNYVMLIGPSGSGKTVALSTICKKFKNNKEWIVITLNSKGDLLKDLIGKLYDTQEFIATFINTELNITPWNVGAVIKSVPPAASSEAALEKILNVISSERKKLLICIDEVGSDPKILYFLNTFNIEYAVNNQPIYILMAGLSSDIHNLSGTQGVSFLIRAEKTSIIPLNMALIESDYEKTLSLDKSFAKKCAELTQGFPTGYQLIGKILYTNNNDLEQKKLIELFDQGLYQSAYKDLISSLSNEEINLLTAEDKSQIMNQDTVRRLRDKGILGEKMSEFEYHVLLPRFVEVCEQYLDGTLY